MTSEDKVNLTAKSLIVFLGFNFICGFSGFFTESYWLSPPAPNIRALILYRSLLQTVTVLLGSGFVVYSIYQGAFIKRIIKWSVPVFIIVTIFILTTSSLENKLHGVSCCGDGPASTTWGYPYGWIKCAGGYNDFCGIEVDRVNPGYLFINYWLGINLAFFIFGAFEDLLKIFQKVIYSRNNKSHLL
jgi:hypothetical protein